MGKSRKLTKETYRRSRNSSSKGSESQEKNKKDVKASWAVMKSILTCKHLQVENPKHKQLKQDYDEISTKLSSSSLSSSMLSARSFGSTKGGSVRFKGLPLGKLSGCNECRILDVNPRLVLARDPSMRSTGYSCSHCGDIFMKPGLLELHQATNHAVSELGPEDTSRNIAEIIFQSSWLNKESLCKIERILKVHNTRRTVSSFEEYRDLIKAKAKQPRCIADGNELLRFHSTTLMCSLGLNASKLCNSIPTCSVCGIIRDGFKLEQSGHGILTTATSSRAHDLHHGPTLSRRAMLVCRVIAGRVYKGDISNAGGLNEYDSVAGVGGVYSDMDELYVHNPKAILPCFVVIYNGVN